MQMRDEPAQSQALDADVEALRRERDELRAQQRALGDVLSVINASGGNLSPVFDCILEHAHQLCGAPCGSLQLFEGNRVVPVAIRGMTPAFAAFLQDGYEISEAVRDFVKSDKARQYADLVETVKATGDAAMRVAVEAGGIHTMATVPLLQGSAVIGRIVAARQEVRPFSDHQMELLHSFASQAVIAIESARLMEAQQAALDRQTATAEILRAIANAPGNAEQSLRRIAEITERLFKASGVSLLIAQGDRFGLTFRVGAGANQINSEIPLAHVHIDPRFMPGAVYLENRQIHVPDVDDSEARARWPGITPARAAGTRTLAGTPLRREGRAIGALIVHRDEIAPFSDDELELLQSFADQAAIAAENARLINETREALERQTATADVLEVIANSPAELQPVFDAIADRANRLIGGLSTAVLWVIGEQIHLAAFTSMGRALDDVLKSMYPRPVADMTGVETLRAGRTVQVTDTETDPQVPERVRNVARVRGYRSLLLTPLILDHGLIGVIFVSRAQPGIFEPRHVELLKTFADQAVIAIQNARLINETREALERQTATADVLKVIASSPSQLQPVFDAIAERSNKLIGGFSTAVLRLSGDTLHLASFTSTGEAGDAALQALFPLPASELPIVGLVSDGVPAQYVDTEADSGVPERIRRLARLRGFRSMLFAPLMSGGTPIGVISVTRKETGRYDPRHVELLRTFADQAVIAIQNVRLFDEVQAKTRDLEESLQQQTATADVLKVISRSAFDLQTVLETLIKSAVELSGAGRGSIFLRDGELFRFRAASHAGHYPEWIQFLKDNPQKSGYHSAIGRAISGAQTVCVPDVLADPDIRMPAQLAGIRTVLAVPLLRDGNVEGIMALSRNTPGSFDARQIELVETFADQAVIAIENARLFGEVQQRTRELSRSLDELRTAQDRLVQTEKLASLGQLTAGIAHEIKNPLNFVNNFSSLSVELIDELLDVLRTAQFADATRADVDELTQMLKGNLDKVVQHGKRADSIVRNMLLHSREGSGEQRPADINALVEESLNLSYHGARAERPGFNITLKRDLAPDAGVAELYPQEITRVLLNLISNGFYAASKRALEAGNGFAPELAAATRSLGDRVEIRIRDNGTGIPAEVREKMFNPFFTTKPAGEGTGLGLSMSHDIVVKQHGGSIAVETEPNAFTEFVIVLPRTTAARS